MIVKFALASILFHFLVFLTHAQDTCENVDCVEPECDAGTEPIYTLFEGTLTIDCVACPENQIKTTVGPEACEACEDGFVSTDGLTCVCQLLTYLNADGECEECPEGLVCTDIGQTIDSIDIEVGYWRGGATADVEECPRIESCIGGLSLVQNSVIVDADSLCASGYEGPLCGSCASGGYITGNYECKNCTRESVGYHILVILIFLSVVGILIYLLFNGQMCNEEELEVVESPDQTLYNYMKHALSWLQKRSDTLLVRFKILVMHFQIIAGFPSVLKIDFPDSFTDLTNSLSVFNFDFWGLLSSGCYFKAHFVNKLLFNTLLPFAVIVIIFIVFFISAKIADRKKHGNFKKFWNSALQAGLLTLFMFYVVTSTTVLQTFDCTVIQLDSKTGEIAAFLRADYSVDCNSDYYKKAKIYAGFMTAIYPVGIPLIYAIVLFNNRKRLNPFPNDSTKSLEIRENDSALQKYQFLWGSYKPGAYAFEVWLTIYKLLLSGLLIYFQQGTTTQATIALLITLLALWIQTLACPFKEQEENVLALCAYWATVLTLIAAVLISAQETESEGVNVTVLGALLSVVNLTVVAIAIMQLFLTAATLMSITLGFIKSSQHQKPAALEQSNSKHHNSTTNINDISKLDTVDSNEFLQSRISTSNQLIELSFEIPQRQSLYKMPPTESQEKLYMSSSVPNEVKEIELESQYDIKAPSRETAVGLSQRTLSTNGHVQLPRCALTCVQEQFTNSEIESTFSAIFNRNNNVQVKSHDERNRASLNIKNVDGNLNANAFGKKIESELLVHNGISNHNQELSWPVRYGYASIESHSVVVVVMPVSIYINKYAARLSQRYAVAAAEPYIVAPESIKSFLPQHSLHII